MFVADSDVRASIVLGLKIAKSRSIQHFCLAIFPAAASRFDYIIDVWGRKYIYACNDVYTISNDSPILEICRSLSLSLSHSRIHVSWRLIYPNRPATFDSETVLIKVSIKMRPIYCGADAFRTYAMITDCYTYTYGGLFIGFQFSRTESRRQNERGRERESGYIYGLVRANPSRGMK